MQKDQLQMELGEQMKTRMFTLHQLIMLRSILDRAGIMTRLGSIINEPKDRIMTSMGYTFSFNDIDVGIIGTQNPKHLLSNIDMYSECLKISKEVVK